MSIVLSLTIRPQFAIVSNAEIKREWVTVEQIWGRKGLIDVMGLSYAKEIMQKKSSANGAQCTFCIVIC